MQEPRKRVPYNDGSEEDSAADHFSDQLNDRHVSESADQESRRCDSPSTTKPADDTSTQETESGSASSRTGLGSADHPESKNDRQSTFECSICLNTPVEAVVTLCGHLFCWRCVSRWMNAGLPQSNTCPVCKSAISREKCIPLFVGGSNDDPRTRQDNEPNTAENNEPRPQAQRTEAPPRAGFYSNGGFQFSAGIGPFPGFMFTYSNNFQRGNGNANNYIPTTEDQEAQAFIARMFLMLGCLVLLGIFFS